MSKVFPRFSVFYLKLLQIIFQFSVYFNLFGKLFVLLIYSKNFSLI